MTGGPVRLTVSVYPPDRNQFSVVVGQVPDSARAADSLAEEAAPPRSRAADAAVKPPASLPRCCSCAVSGLAVFPRKLMPSRHAGDRTVLVSAAGQPRHGAMTDNLRIRRGTTRGRRRSSGLIDEAAGWLRGKGTDQWAQPWPDRATRDGRVRRGLRDGNTWIAEADGRPIATITYRPHGNQKLWTPQEDRTPAVYLSRLIVTRSAAGLDVGAAMIDWAAARAVRDWNAQWIRIDVWTTNVALHNYYEKRGFRHLRIAQCQAEDYPSAALFQKPTSEIDLAAGHSFEIDPTARTGRSARRRLSRAGGRSGRLGLARRVGHHDRKPHRKVSVS